MATLLQQQFPAEASVTTSLGNTYPTPFLLNFNGWFIIGTADAAAAAPMLAEAPSELVPIRVNTTRVACMFAFAAYPEPTAYRELGIYFPFTPSSSPVNLPTDDCWAVAGQLTNANVTLLAWRLILSSGAVGADATELGRDYFGWPKYQGEVLVTADAAANTARCAVRDEAQVPLLDIRLPNHASATATLKGALGMMWQNGWWQTWGNLARKPACLNLVTPRTFEQTRFPMYVVTQAASMAPWDPAVCQLTIHNTSAVGQQLAAIEFRPLAWQKYGDAQLALPLIPGHNDKRKPLQKP